MKRFFLLIMCLVMLLGTACAPSELNTGSETLPQSSEPSPTVGEQIIDKGIYDATGFAAGFGRVDISPTYPVSMGGYGNVSSRRSGAILDPLYATCVAISDGENTVLLYSVDLCGVSKANFNQVAIRVKKKLGIPSENIFITATHSHSSPEIRSDDISLSAYKKKFYEDMTQAAVDAVADLDKTELFIGSAETDNLNYVRRYFREDGTFGGAGSSATPSPYVRHETEADGQMQVLKLDRKNQKDIVLVNWQCHPCAAGSSPSSTDVSADFVGVLRKEAEKNLDVYFSYYQGGAANLGYFSWIDGEPDHFDYKAHGKKLAEVLYQALENLTAVKSGKVQALSLDYEARRPDFSQYDVEMARKIVQANAAGNGALASRLMNQAGIRSLHLARNIVMIDELTDTKESAILNIGAISIGDVAFTGVPYEMFDTSGKEIKSASSFAMTFTLGYTNGSNGYMPSINSFPNGAYEVDSCHFEAGTAEGVVSSLLNMLQTMKSAG